MHALGVGTGVGVAVGHSRVPSLTGPQLSAATAGTATADGCTGAGVTTNTGNGTLYWAVVTNGGSCTTAQIKAGTGGSIVTGKAGSQAVSLTGAQTIANITGLTAGTTYQIKFLQTNISSQDSLMSSVDLNTLAPGKLLMQDGTGILLQDGTHVLLQQ